MNKAVAYLRKDFLYQSSYYVHFVTNIVSVIFSVYIFFFFSEFLDDSIYLAKYGNSYFYFLIIGISVSDISIRVANNLNNEIRHYQLTGLFEEILNFDIGPFQFFILSFIYPIFSSLIRISLYFVTAVLMFNLEINLSYISFIFLVLLLTIFCFLGISLISGAYILIFKRGNPLSRINQVSILLLSGALFPVSALPDWLYPLSQFIPITHAIEIIRILFLPDYELSTDIYTNLLWLISLTISFILLGVFLFSIALTHCKKRGSLNFY